MKTHRSLLLVVSILTGLVGDWESQAQTFEERIAKRFSYRVPDAEHARHFRVGGVVGLNLKASFSMGGEFSVSGNNPGPTGVSGKDHIFDDGFVKVDASGNDGGLTWNWGYQNAGQLDGERLYFHAADSFTGKLSSGEQSGVQAGIEVAYGANVARIKSALVGWQLGFVYLPITIEDDKHTPVNVARSIYSFDASGIEKFPDAPYQGTFNGPGALLDDVAQFEGNDTLDGTLTGSRSLDVSLYSLRFGPTVHWELPARFAVSLSAGGAIGIVSGDLAFDEVIQLSDGTQARNNGSSGSSKVIYGGYVAGTVIWHAVEDGDFYIGVQYMPLTDAKFQGVNREAHLDLSGGLYFSAGINWPF
jgi:hypothetical protein